MSSITQSRDSDSDLAVKSDIDFDKYQSDDLVERIVELINVPGAIRQVAKVATLMVIPAIWVCWMVKEYADLQTLPWLIACGYTLLVAVLFGGILGVLRIVSAATCNVEQVLGISLDITSKIAVDYKEVQAGKAQLPSGGKLVETVYLRVILPMLEKAISECFGFLRPPVLWGYRMTIGTAIRLVIRRLSHSTAEEKSERISKEVESGMAEVAKYSDSIQAYTEKAAEMVTSVGYGIRTFAMLPLYVGFAICLALTVAPIFIVIYIS